MSADAYETTILRWRESRAARLVAPTGWLTLVDRIELSEGDNQLPFGTLTLEAGVAQLKVRAGAGVTCQDAPVSDRVWRSEEDGGAEALQHQGRTYELFKRGDAYAVRVRDTNAPARRTFPGLDYFPIDPALRIRAHFRALWRNTDTHEVVLAKAVTQGRYSWLERGVLPVPDTGERVSTWETGPSTEKDVRRRLPQG